MLNIFNEWKENATRFLEVRANLIKLSFVERTSNVLSYLIYVFILLFLAITVLIFLGISLQETFSHWFDSRILGAFATLGLYLVLAAIVILARKSILNAFAGIFVRMLTAEDEDDYEHGQKIQVKD
ncbi:MAG: hypothetical protein EOP52_01600 [Sphingobacteriales bacterium]|nr:MAG: hypothetical protein EOP52_01600 [Sphingobacteriales bacterium]